MHCIVSQAMEAMEHQLKEIPETSEFDKLYC